MQPGLAGFASSVDPPARNAVTGHRNLTRLKRCIYVGSALLLFGLVPSSAAARTWVQEATPSPHPSRRVIDPSLTSVSCSSANACTAVGFYDNGSHGETPIAERFNGSRWAPQRIVLPTSVDWSDHNELDGVDCVSAFNCLAVGFYIVSVARPPFVMLVEHLRDHNASLEHPPTPSNFDQVVISLADISCTSALDCVAVGEYFVPQDNNSRVLVERLEAGSWHVESAPSPSAWNADLFDVSCPSPQDCIAIGSRIVPGRGESPLIEHLHRGRWTTEMPAPIPRSKASWLNDVNCVSVRNCLAVGYAEDRHDRFLDRQLIEHYNGRRWVVERRPAFARAQNIQLNSVSCLSRNDCVIVGYVHNRSRTRESALVEELKGTSWRRERAPTGFNSSLLDVSCEPLARSCTAVGVIQPGRKRQWRTLAEQGFAGSR